MVSRLTFEVKRRAAYPEAAFIAAVVMPAQHEGLRGRFEVKGADRYTCVLEGSKEAADNFKTYLETLEAAVGDVTGLRVTHHHDNYALSSRAVRMVFPE